MTEPSYDEILEVVQEKAFLISNADHPDLVLDYAQDIMDALAEAYHLGHNNGMKCVAEMLVSAEVPVIKPNPYQRTADPRAFL